MDWLWVFVEACTAHSADFSSITCAWSLTKTEGLVEYLKTVEDRYVVMSLWQGSQGPAEGTHRQFARSKVKFRIKICRDLTLWLW